ncbi:MAG: hypothetical protein KGS46_15905 [Chloroflexi bacterium]|nr:hypothetical protein [Chloroflexota bacterium]
MTSETLSTTAGMILSLVFSYAPVVRDKFETLNPNQKRAVMGICIIGVGIASFALGCAGLTNYVTCDQPGMVGVIRSVIDALVANQAMFLLTPKRND